MKIIYGLTSLLIFASISGKAGIEPAKTIVVKGTVVDRKGFNPLNMRESAIEFTVEYPSAAIAARSSLIKLPLYDGKKWAFSARWDDNNMSNYRMHDLMNKYGFKGSFYLNSAFRDNKNIPPEWKIQMPEKLSNDGFSVGAHSMTHPKLPGLEKNDMFREVSKIRLELEASYNCPVISFAFPYGAFSEKNDPGIHVDIAEALFRTGYHHNTYSSFVKPEAGVSPQTVSSVVNIRPGDRDTSVLNFDKDVAKVENSAQINQKFPCMTLATHVWLKGKDWDAMEAGLKKYAARPDWWYCNQNEYAAYRYQFSHSKLEKSRPPAIR